MLRSEFEAERAAEAREARIRAEAARIFNAQEKAAAAADAKAGKGDAGKKGDGGGKDKGDGAKKGDGKGDGDGKKGAAKAAAADAGDRARGFYRWQRDVGHKLTDATAGKLQQAAVKHDTPGLKKVPIGALQKGFRFVPVAGNVASAVLAVKALNEGRYVDAALGALGAVPGPVGWIGMGLNLLVNDDGGSYNAWAAPDGRNTFTLPGSEEQNVKTADAILTSIQRNLYGYSDGPDGVSWQQGGTVDQPIPLDTPAVKDAVTAWLAGIADAYDAVDQALRNSGEDYFLQYREKLAPTFAAMRALPDQAPLIMAQLKHAADAAGGSHGAFRTANRELRESWAANSGKLDGSTGATRTLEDAVVQNAAKIRAATGSIDGLFTEQLTPLTAVYGARTASNASNEKPKPETKPDTTPAPQPAPTPTPQPKPDSGVDKLLDQLGKQGTPATGNPLGASPLGGSPLSGLGQQTPAPAGLKDLGKQAEEPKKLKDPADDKSKDQRREIRPLTGLDNSRQQQQPAAAAPQPGPAPAAAMPAPGPGTGQSKPEAKAAEAKPETKVDVKGKKGVEFPDPKTAKMAQLLAGADPAKPLSLADAAAQAGLKPPVPGQDLGQQIPPAKSAPGDILVAGDQRFMVLGDGEFYDLQKYDVVGADAVPTQLGERGGYFRLPDAGGGAALGGPVSGPAPADVTYPVPGGAEPAVEPTAVPPLGRSGGDDDGGGGGGGGGGGFTSGGTPGLPTVGKPGTGPANAAETSTGSGGTQPSVAPRRMDPGAVG
ncbi:hypothetical protein [Mycolicibacterium fallax]|uniref:Uncharacterized protein n=1 Tax=Mycolicibacterium fallax TaxID=1793 RepID=A0A1X1QZ76_MYCFA|nr:hypothetical protein [Mycolicibacterium fallax]ORU96761.1 hypothetical protein AWC04_19530 [Mycolicibacterium fallax]BBY97883.1 hypothetical protein MFAL_13500 [Mycolicibacterium fallax]